MSERTRNWLIASLMVAIAVTTIGLVMTAPGDVDRVEAIGRRIKCPVCQGESIAASPSSMAQDMMDLVAERVAAGDSDEAIVDQLMASFSGAVLLDPPASGATLPLWLAPLAALAVGALVIWWWRRHPSAARDEEEPRARSRLYPILGLALAVGAVVVVASLFVQEGEGAATGVADLGAQDLENVSNETMEAVIAANADNPQVSGMRLALAERYFEAGDYRSAFPHYLEVAGSPNSSDEQVVAALVRLGWMAWDGNGEADAALGLFDQALEIDPGSTTAMYVKGEVLWCGKGDVAAAEDLFRSVLADPGLGASSRDSVEADLAAMTAGEECA